MGWNYTDGDKSTRLFSCGLTREVFATFGQKMIVDYLAEEIRIDEFDALAIPGGFEKYGFYAEAYSDPFLNIIKGFHAAGKPIASICDAG